MCPEPVSSLTVPFFTSFDLVPCVHSLSIVYHGLSRAGPFVVDFCHIYPVHSVCVCQGVPGVFTLSPRCHVSCRVFSPGVSCVRICPEC